MWVDAYYVAQNLIDGGGEGTYARQIAFISLQQGTSCNRELLATGNCEYSFTVPLAAGALTCVSMLCLGVVPLAGQCLLGLHGCAA